MPRPWLPRYSAFTSWQTVIPNEDQKLKFGVRDLLLEEIRRGFSSDEEGEEQTSQKARLQSYILLHRDELETLAGSFLEEQGKPDQVQIRLESAYFPTRFYGDIVFPCGIYDAVRVIIGGRKRP